MKPITQRAPHAASSDAVGQRRRQRATEEPLAILEYKKGKGGIDFSDQMASYATTLRKGVKWYRKLATELLLGVSVVNARVVYKEVTNTKIKISNFKELLVEHWSNCYQMPVLSRLQLQVLLRHITIWLSV